MKCDMSKEKLIDIITKASFAMDDVKLFLDTHPNCMEALEYYHKAKEMREEAWEMYTHNFGPLSAYDVAIRTTGTGIKVQCLGKEVTANV